MGSTRQTRDGSGRGPVDRVTIATPATRHGQRRGKRAQRSPAGRQLRRRGSRRRTSRVHLRAADQAGAPRDQRHAGREARQPRARGRLEGGRVDPGDRAPLLGPGPGAARSTSTSTTSKSAGCGSGGPRGTTATSPSASSAGPKKHPPVPSYQVDRGRFENFLWDGRRSRSRPVRRLPRQGHRPGRRVATGSR